MKVFSLIGSKNSGKTTLVVRLLLELNRRGIKVSTVKQAHDGFEMDQPGKDSYKHQMAGASEVLIASDRRWALLHERGLNDVFDIDKIIGNLAPVDIVLMEGVRATRHSKIEVYREENAKPLLCLDDASIIAVAAKGQVPDLRVPVLPLDDVSAVADFLIQQPGLRAVA